MIATSGKIRYGSGFKYQLKNFFWVQTKIAGNHSRIEDLDNLRSPWVRVTLDGVLEIKAGYAWDGASGPTFDTRSTMRASLVHDALYQLMRAGKLSQAERDEADKLLYDLMIQDGAFAWRAKLWLWTLRRFAGYAAEQRPENIQEAP